MACVLEKRCRSDDGRSDDGCSDESDHDRHMVVNVFRFVIPQAKKGGHNLKPKTHEGCHLLAAPGAWHSSFSAATPAAPPPFWTEAVAAARGVHRGRVGQRLYYVGRISALCSEGRERSCSRSLGMAAGAGMAVGLCGATGSVLLYATALPPWSGDVLKGFPQATDGIYSVDDTAQQRIAATAVTGAAMLTAAKRAEPMMRSAAKRGV